MLANGQQRLLTASEEADFLIRHPGEAARVAETKAFLLTVGYDQILTPPEWYQFDFTIGLIPPSGDVINDDTYGRVVIFPAVNGNIYFNANVPSNIGTTIGQPQVPGSPGAPTGGPPEPSWLDQLNEFLKDAKNLLIVGVIAYLFLREK